MISTGEFRSNNESYCVAIQHEVNPSKVLLVLWVGNEVKSVFYKKGLEEFSAYNNKAKKLYEELIAYGLSKCNNKNGSMQPFALGASMLHTFAYGKVNVKSGNMELFNKEIVSCQIDNVEYNNDGTENKHSLIVTQYNDREDMKNWLFSIENTTQFVKLHTSASELTKLKGGSNILIKSVEEIALEKEDLTWLQNKKYYIVNDDYQAEQIFSIIENYGGLIGYDVETTGLRINKFGKVGSIDAERLEQHNKEHPDEYLRVDKLVGIIFCIEPNVSYYFPVGNLKFKNLYESGEVRSSLIRNIKARYTVGDKAKVVGDEANYIRTTPEETFRRDVILMERVRDILERKNIGTHGGGYEQKVAFYYDILVNIVDDSMILHQIMYKFRGTTSNRGEPSNLKHLSKVDLGIDQWELKDFFPQYKEMEGETKNVSPIDFSLMEYDGTKIYAPTDGDCTLQLIMKYKKDMMENHRDQVYIYTVELAVMRAMAYMEFYGIRFDVNKINHKRDDTIHHLLILESKFRECIGFSSDKELSLREQLESGIDVEKELREEIDGSSRKINLNAPAQVADVFYDMLGYPTSGDSRSVDKKKIKALCQYKNEDGTDKYPAAHIYKEYKAEMTLLTKFFGKLQDFMYLDGFVFASFNQLATATGRMSCKGPNLQQMPKSITKIIIPRENCVFCDADYSQIEYRTLCGMAHEQTLIDKFKDPDMDYHTQMASLMYSVKYEDVTKQMRSDSKSLNFGIPYGMGNNSLAILLFGVGNAVNRELAAEKKELYFKNQPNVRQFFADVKEQAQIYGITKTLWNRVRAYTFVRPDGTVNDAARASALRQAGNACIQGSAADIFKIGVARNFMWIVQNGLLGKVFISNMIHDEQLVEINYKEVNVKKAVANVGANMGFRVEGLPPLYVGAGVSDSWYKAKDSLAEIHPNLMAEYQVGTANEPLLNYGTYESLDECVKAFDEFNHTFRRNKIANYLLDEKNRGSKLHPVIGSLIKLAFNYGKDDASIEELLKEFIEREHIDGVSPEMFSSDWNEAQDEEEDKEYDDGEEADVEDSVFDEYEFTMIDESSKVYGMSIVDWIETFTLVASEEKKLVGIDTRKISYKLLNNLIEYLSDHACNKEEPGAMRVAFLKGGRILEYTDAYVKDIDSMEFYRMRGKGA